ncbi:MAG: 2-nitropropane dioxygenase [Phycisphaerae bacterium]|nr:MAG: 2-nitropropane dioxygenase [Phycisphaerae bacterium]
MTPFLGLRYPILQAPIGNIATVALAAAVSNAGGMGSLALTWTEPHVAQKLVGELKAITSNPFFVNFVLSFPPHALDTALEMGAPAVTFSWGRPSDRIARVHAAGAIAGVQIASLDDARMALDDGADFLICQGQEAGGHVQSTQPLFDLLSNTVGIANPVPVVAAGGISDGEDMAQAVLAGAQAIMMGTRFVAVQESAAHDLYRTAILESQSDDSVYTYCFDGGWPNAAHRVLRNDTLTAWEAAGCPKSGDRPGEGDTLAQNDSGASIRRYDITPPTIGMNGAIHDCCLYAGAGCGKINDIPSASDVLKRIWSEYERAAKRGVHE